MITLKYWNSLTPQCRMSIVHKFYRDTSAVGELSMEYHHNFDYNHTGKELKEILSHCYIKGKYIEVRCLVFSAFYKSFPTTEKALKETKKPVSHRYYFRMYTESDPEDGETIWEEAYSEDSARNKAYDDFHSIVRLDLLRVE